MEADAYVFFVPKALIIGLALQWNSKNLVVFVNLHFCFGDFDPKCFCVEGKN